MKKKISDKRGMFLSRFSLCEGTFYRGEGESGRSVKSKVRYNDKSDFVMYEMGIE